MPVRKLETPSIDSLGFLLGRCARLYERRSFARLQEDFPRLRRAHLDLLPYLRNEGTRVTDLAYALRITKQSVAKTVDDLTRMGFLEKTVDPSDRRAKIVRLTKSGRRALSSGLEAMRAVEAELADELGDMVLGDLKAMLTVIMPDLESLTARLR